MWRTPALSEADQSAVFLQSYHGVGLGGLLVVIRAEAGGRAGVSVVPFCDIKTAGGKIILIFPSTNCAGRLVSADLVRISLIG